MESFTFLFGIMLGEDFFTIIDHLSRAIQKESPSAVEARAYAAVTVSTLMEKRSDDYFERFWDKVTARAHQLGVEELALPRKRRAPSRVDKKCKDKFPRRNNSRNSIGDTTLRLQTNSQVKFRGSKHPNLSYTVKLKDCSRRLLMVISLIMTLFKR